MASIHADILVAHPYKHHALHLAAGCALADASTAFALPFYRRGLGAAVARLPGSIGRKASGYFHPGLRKVRLLQSLAWQTRKLWSFLGDPHDIEKPYDAYVAARLLSGEWRARVVVTLQDHMPRTSAAARQIGAVLWSDQIINLSAAARARIAMHVQRCGASAAILENNEDANTQVLAAADVVTAPSQYTLDGLGDRIRRGAQVHRVPYGVDAARFDVRHVDEGDAFTIVARAHSVRKGGHLLLEALLRFHQRWAQLVRPRRLRIVFLGAFEPALLPMYEKVRALPTVSVRAGNIPNADVPALFASSHLFLMPTLSESMSLACVEAMRASLPLLITEYAGVDCFVDGEMGLLLEDTVESIDAAVVRALGDPQQLARWRINVREASNALTWETYEQSMAGVAASAVAMS
jgi:glycosyltransferase involved in cell wall biosynthesis